MTTFSRWRDGILVTPRFPWSWNRKILRVIYSTSILSSNGNSYLDYCGVYNEEGWEGKQTAMSPAERNRKILRVTYSTSILWISENSNPRHCHGCGEEGEMEQILHAFRRTESKNPKGHILHSYTLDQSKSWFGILPEL